MHATGDATMVYRSVADPTAGTVYETGVSNEVYNVQVAATPAHSGASVAIKTINSATAPDATAIAAASVDADGVVDVIVGYQNYVIAEVTAENGVNSAAYILKVNRAPASASSDAKLIATTGLVLSSPSVTLMPAYDPDTMAYSAEVTDSVEMVTVTATGYAHADVATNFDQATVSIMSNRDDDSSDTNAALNVAAHVIDIMPGANVITIMVTAADYETMETYTVTVTAPSQEPRDEAALLAMYDTNGTTGIQIDEGRAGC